MKYLKYAIPVFLLLIPLETSAAWQDDLDKLIAANSPVEQQRLLDKVVKAAPGWQEVAAYIQSIRVREVETGIFNVRTTNCTDGVERPWVLYVPPDYDPAVPTPMGVVLHGGVSRSSIFEEPERYAREHEFTRLAEKRGWLLVFPFGQAGATWWDEVGMANIKNLVRTVKREYNVDDDRVWMGGFSDGASAAFLHAMVDPTDYAAFVALNGHMGVGSLDGNLPTYAPNFFNTPVYAVTTDKDRLYPTETMRHAIEMAQDAGGKILYRQQEGGHDLSDYAEEELPVIARFLERRVRDPFPTEIIWETGDKRFGLCRWFSIDRITPDEPAPWHTDHNLAMVDSSIIIGFAPDYSYEGEGIKVDRVVGEKSLAEQIGLLSGDIIIKADDYRIATMDDLNAFKKTVRRGDPVVLTVKRDQRELRLKGKLPDTEIYFIFKRDRPSAMAKVSACGNRIDVEASRVGAFGIRIHPDMFRLEQELIIRINGEEVAKRRIAPSVRYLLTNFLENRDRKLLYVAEVKIGL